MDVDIGDPASSSVPGGLSFDESGDFKKHADDHAVGDLCAGFCDGIFKSCGADQAPSMIFDTSGAAGNGGPALEVNFAGIV